MRATVPNRRVSEIVEFMHGGIHYAGQISYLDNGRPCEVFLEGGKVGAAVQALARDTAVSASLALQGGIDIAVLHATLTRDDAGLAAGPLGHLLDLAGVR